MSDLQIFAFILLWVVILVEGFLLFLLYRHVVLIHAPPKSGLAVGSSAPPFLGKNSIGEMVRSDDLLVGNNNIFIFSSLDCAPCVNLLNDISGNHFLSQVEDQLHFLIPMDQLTESPQSKDISNLLIGVDQEVFNTYDVPGTPFVYILDSAKKVAVQGSVKDMQDLKRLMNKDHSVTESRLSEVLSLDSAKSAPTK